MLRCPREVEVTMGFKLGTKGKIKLVEASAEVHFQVTIRWDSGEKEAERRWSTTPSGSPAC
jgi:hypothetical protein